MSKFDHNNIDPKEVYLEHLVSKKNPLDNEKRMAAALHAVLVQAWQETQRRYTPLSLSAKRNGYPFGLAKEIMHATKPLEFACTKIPHEPMRLKSFTPEETLNIITDAFSYFHPELGKAAKNIVEQQRVDFTPIPRGAMCWGKTSDTSDANRENVPPGAASVKAAYRHLSFVCASAVAREDGTLAPRSVIIAGHEFGHAAAFDLTTNVSHSILSNPLTETYAALGERILMHRLMESELYSPYQKYTTTRQYCAYLHDVMNNGMYAKLMDKLLWVARPPRSLLIGIEELSQISRQTFQVLEKTGNFSSSAYQKQWLHGHYYTQTDPYYSLSYVLAHAAAETFFQRWIDAKPFQRVQMSDALVEVMKEGSRLNYTTAMQRLGIDVRAPGFIKNGIDGLHHYDRVAMENLKTSQLGAQMHVEWTQRIQQIPSTPAPAAPPRP